MRKETGDGALSSSGAGDRGEHDDALTNDGGEFNGGNALNTT